MTISGTSHELKLLLAKLDSRVGIADWKRDIQAKDDITRLLLGHEVVRCFRNLTAQDNAGVRLWLDVSEEEWKVTNIVPERDSISPATYHCLLVSFRNALLPLLDGTQIKVSTPTLEVGPEHWLSPKATRLLRQFSSAANRSTGAGHPLDRKRWNAFVIAAHQDASTLTGDVLRAILIEDERWPEEKADELAILFEHERTVLDDFVKSA